MFLNDILQTRSHALRSSNICPICALGFSTPNLLDDHIVKFHDSDNLNCLSPSPSDLIQGNSVESK